MYPLTARSLGHHMWFCNQFPPFSPVLHCPLGLGELQAYPFPNVVLPPLPPSALSSSFIRSLHNAIFKKKKKKKTCLGALYLSRKMTSNTLCDFHRLDNCQMKLKKSLGRKRAKMCVFFVFFSLFHLRACYGCSVNMCAKEFCSEFDRLRPQPCWFALHQREAERGGSWRQGHCCHTHWPCSE